MYRVIEEWKIPNGGFGRAVVIDPAHRNERDMRALGDKLRADNGAGRNAFVFVYDDERAARMRKDAVDDTLSEKDDAYFDKHYIGIYNRNKTTGFHALSLFLDGAAGETIRIKY